MRKLVSAGLAVTALLAVVAVAIAQTTAAPAVVKVTAKVKPTKGGSPKNPKNASTKIVFTVNRESKSTLAGIKYSIPKSIRISGKGFPKCTADMVNSQGEGACPKGSKVGTGSSIAYLGTNRIDFSVNVFAAGPKGLTLSLTTVGGTDTAAVFPAKITKKSISFDIPPNIQQPVPGPPAEGKFSYVTSVTADLGPAKHKGNFLVSRVGCFGGKDKETVTLPLADNPNPPAKRVIKGTDSGKCKK